MRLKSLLIVFAIALGVECFANALNLAVIQYVSKPSLMLILIYYFTRNSIGLGPQKLLIIAALVFSWIGDVVLLFDKYYGQLFVVGLISFIIAHIFYAVYFVQIRKINGQSSGIRILIFCAVLIYSIGFYLILFPNLGALKLQVLIYAAVISIMLLASFHSFRFKDQVFGRISVAGTILFTVSDSILAINRFAFPIAFGGVLVMLFYSVGQLLITEGSLRNLQNHQA